MELKQRKSVDAGVEKSFSEWQNGILQTIVHLQAENVIKSIDIYADILLNKKENFIAKGHTLIQELKKQFCSFWNGVESTLEYPKISFSKTLEESMKDIAKMDLWGGS